MTLYGKSCSTTKLSSHSAADTSTRTTYTAEENSVFKFFSSAVIITNFYISDKVLFCFWTFLLLFLLSF